MKLSIIIPVYNGAEEIERCLDSIYSQGLAGNPAKRIGDTSL